MNDLSLTTNGGIEDLVEEEWRERADRADIPYDDVVQEPYDVPGHVRVTTDAASDATVPVAREMRSIHHVLRYVSVFEFDPDAPLDSIESELRSITLPELEPADTFRITSNRYGDHEFTSVDVQSAAGAGVEAAHEIGVDLEEFDVEVRVDVHDDEVLVGVQQTRRSLSKRHPREYSPTASLKTNVAWAMLQLAHIDEHEPARLLDPFCGAGTILIEAAQTRPELELLGSDIKDRAVEGTRTNTDAAGVGERIDVRVADARELTRHYSARSTDLVVTNPPFGLRVGSDLDFNAFYNDLLGQLTSVLTHGGRAVVLVEKRAVFRGELGHYPQLDLRHVRIVETGGLYPGIFVLQRR